MGIFPVLCALLMLVLAGTASSSTKQVRAGGTFNIDAANDVQYTDPALEYESNGWQIEYATCLKLMNYPDANGGKGSQLAPEAATGFPKVSNNGKTYDFTVNASFTKFSNGQPVTAASFKAAFDRAADPKMQSPAVAFMGDVIGSDKSPVSGVQVKGAHLIVNLKADAPDFLARVAMPFFCAVPTNLAHDPNGVTPPGSGPYYISAHTPNQRLTLKLNPYYKGKRPHNWSTIDFTIGNALQASYLRVDNGTSDYSEFGIPPSSYAEVAQKYGVNKGRFMVRPELVTSYLALNHDQAFKGAKGAYLAKAVNYAIDRKAILAQGGFLGGKRADQILPPGMPGFRDASLYPLKGPDFTTAKKFAAKAGVTSGMQLSYYHRNYGSAPLSAQIIQFDLKQIGINLQLHPFTFPVLLDKAGTKGEPFDMAGMAWGADYVDPYDFINVNLAGSNIQQSNNVNFAYYNIPQFNTQMRQASLLSGSARYAAYGKLDVNMMYNNPPWAVTAYANNRDFLSARIGCYVYNPIYTMDFAAACVK